MPMNGKLDRIICHSSDCCSRVSTNSDNKELSTANQSSDASFSMDLGSIKQQLEPPVYVDTE